METRKNFGTTIIAAIVSCLLTVISCSTRQTAEDFVPAEPNYDKPSQWYMTDRHGQADIFYIISTETGDYLRTDGSICHYADTYADSLRAPLLGEMKGVDTLLSGRLNFYAPYYRQCSLQSFGSDSVARERLPLAVDDVRRAFAHYLKNNNQGRPFILAGFSQGAVIALQLMSEMNDETYARMVAAYIIGTNISQEMLDNNSRIRPAQGADDTGVTICYNSVRDESCSLWPRSAVAINPANWHTDSQEATIITEPSPLVPIDQQPKDTLRVHLDTASNLVFVGGYTAKDYVLPLIGKEGNYHSREIWLYPDQLRENMELRASAFLK
jgi:hypothetical protein